MDIQLNSAYVDEANVENDIQIKDGRLTLTYDVREEVRQKLSVRLNTFLGEWFVDTLVGMPYFQRILSKGADKNLADSIIRNKIKDTEGVSQILSFNSTFNTKTRVYKVTFICSVIGTDETITIEI